MARVLRNGYPPYAPRWLAGVRLIDVGIAVVVTGLSLAGSYTATSWHPHISQINGVGCLLVTTGGASLTVMRRYPAVVLGVTLTAALLAESVGHAQMPWLPVITAFFTAVRARRRIAVIASLIIGYLVAVWPPWLIGSHGHIHTASALSLLWGLLLLLSVAELVSAAIQRRLAAQRMREQELLRFASEERMRIARDLHDVLAHNISVINVQANTALHISDRHPERAQQALSTINDVSRQTLAELRSVLGILRADSDAAPRAPAPGLAELDTLVANMAAARLKVEVRTEGSPIPLPASVDLAAYRIIQEALTNTARHSGAMLATVLVRYGVSEVEIVVEDEGATGLKPPRHAGTGTGSGIAGMADRARALGGQLSAGPCPGGGFRVTALLPLTGGDR